MSFIVLGDRWCNIVVLNVHAPSEEKTDDSKGSFMRNYSRVSVIFVSTIQSFCNKTLMEKRGERIFSNRKLGVTVYIRIVILVIE